jgi:hypothetical protein
VLPLADSFFCFSMLVGTVAFHSMNASLQIANRNNHAKRQYGSYKTYIMQSQGECWLNPSQQMPAVILGLIELAARAQSEDTFCHNRVSYSLGKSAVCLWVPKYPNKWTAVAMHTTRVATLGAFSARIDLPSKKVGD